MKEILFSGKRVDNGEWVEGHLIWFEDGRARITPRHTDIFSNESGESIYHIAYEVIPETVRQYTGMTACWHEFENEPQEEDVWEHDLLEVSYEHKKVIAEVKFEAGMFILCSNEFSDGYIPLFDVVVFEDDCYIQAKKVGNIHDNPELLRGE